MLLQNNLLNKLSAMQFKPLLRRSKHTLSISRIFKNPSTHKEVEIQGWVKSLRKMKENLFLDISDGSCPDKLQVLVPRGHKPEHLTTGTSVTVNGLLNRSPKGQLELHANQIEVYGKCEITDGYPFAPRKSYPSDYIRQYLHFRPRTNKFSSLLRVRDTSTLMIHNYFHENEYIHIHTPILTSNDCEGAGEVFIVNLENAETLKIMLKQDVPLEEAYFNSKVYLTVSGQLHLEAAAHGLSKVYCFGPTFRAENSKSRLHLSEFYMLEAECAFLNEIEQVADVVEKLMKSVTRKVLDKSMEDVRVCQEEEVSFDWLDKSFVTLTYDEAAGILNKNTDKYAGGFNYEMGLTKEHEKFLVKYCSNVPTFVINWPKSIKPFYMKECHDDESKVAALDLLVPGVGELVGGSLRESSHEKLKEKSPNRKGELDWYLEIRKFGGVPTGGFGLGFERYLQMLLGISNIKDTIPFPRWPHNCKL